MKCSYSAPVAFFKMAEEATNWFIKHTFCKLYNKNQLIVIQRHCKNLKQHSITAYLSLDVLKRNK